MPVFTREVSMLKFANGDSSREGDVIKRKPSILVPSQLTSPLTSPVKIGILYQIIDYYNKLKFYHRVIFQNHINHLNISGRRPNMLLDLT